MKDENFLKENNARFQWHPMGHPGAALKDPPRIITGADGVHITDIDGHRVVDAVGGLWNVNLGFSNSAIKAAIAAQLEALPYYSSFSGTANDAEIELSYVLQEFFAPDGLSRAFFTSGGSDSVDVALKLARQYHHVRGESGRTKFISLVKGYHGTHFGGASVNGNAKFRHPYEPLLPGCIHIPGPYLYRNPFGVTTPEALAQKCAEALEDAILFQGAHTVAAFIMEPVLGAGGAINPHPSFMPLMREVCDRHGVLLIADEVITAFGRTGSQSGSRHWGVQPDLMTTAKAITNGYFPFGAVMISDHVAQVFEEGDGRASVDTGYTYSGHPVGAAAAVVCMAETERLKPWENAAALSPVMSTGLHGLKDAFDLVGDVRGTGLMWALELVSDQAAKTPAAPETMQAFQKAAWEAGAMIRVSGNIAIFSPSLVLTEGDAETILAAARAGLAAVS